MKPKNPAVLRALFLVWAVTLPALIGTILSLIAGTWSLPMLWAYIGVLTVLMIYAMAFIDPDLVRERRKPGPGARDKHVLIVLRLLFWTSLVIAAVDIGRTHWSDTIPPALQIAALIGFAAGFGLAIRAMIVNRFFSAVVRLQTDRGHHVVTDGPYRIVRHPGYLGIIVGCFCSPLALGSWLAAILMIPCIAIFLRRTVIEDRFLRESLDGYAQYAERVPYRLTPYLW